jgi:hypothetical protein
MRSHAMPDLFGLGILIVVLGSAAIGSGRRILERRRARRELREKPALVAASREGTWVRVTGVVRVDEQTLEAPLSGVTCVVFRARITAGRHLARRAARPTQQLAMVPFVLDRGAEGAVSIEGEHALLDLPPRDLRKADRARRDRFALAQGVSLKEAARAIYEETVVEPGAVIAVAGMVMKDPVTAPPTAELGFRDAPPPALRLAGNADHPLVIGAVNP